MRRKGLIGAGIICCIWMAYDVYRQTRWVFSRPTPRQITENNRKAQYEDN